MCAKRLAPTASTKTDAPTAVEQVRSQYSAMTSSHRKVADYVLAHPFEAATLSIDAMARHCDTSVTTMNRFASNLGYGGYSSFRAHWQQLLQAPSMLAPLDKLQQQRSTAAPLDQRFQTALHAGAAQLQTAAALLAPATLDAAAQLLTQARHIAVLGSDVSAYLAGYLVSYASLFRNQVDNLSSLGGASEAQRRVLALGKDDVLVALSLPRYSELTVNLCALAHERGVPVIALTDQPNAPIAPYAQHLLLAPTQHPMLPASGVAALGLLEGLCTMLAAASPRSPDEMLRLSQGAARFHMDS